MSPPTITIRAHAKINLDLRVLGPRLDGYHELRTVYQTIALHDVIECVSREGPLAIECDAAGVPLDGSNLVWRAADALWRALRRRTPARDVLIRLQKNIPLQAGLGGGSADAAATLMALSRLWKVPVRPAQLTDVAATLGADVPFFLAGGTALGLGRGDDIYPLPDLPRTHVVIVRPKFGVSTAEAYGWYDSEPRRTVREPARRPLPEHWPEWAFNLRNDLEPAVAGHHPTIGRIKQALMDAGAVVAAMSGSGSAVFGLFERLDAARRTVSDLARPDWLVLATRTASRSEYGRKVRPLLARTRKRRIS